MFGCGKVKKKMLLEGVPKSIKGREEGRRSLINKMLENGATVEQIAKMLNVDVAEIENML